MDKLDKINKLREKVEKLKSEQDRIAGRIETQEQRLKEIESECKEKYDCEVEALPKLAESLEEESNKLVLEAENILSESEKKNE